MSYILDALKRADAERERERGAVPGLHSQPPTTAPATAALSAPRRRTPMVLLGLVALLSVAAGLWWFTRPAPPPPAQVLVAVPVPPAPMPPDPEPQAATAAPQPPPPMLRPEPVATPATTAPATPASPTAVAASTRLLEAAGPAKPEAAETGVLRFADLSPEQRAQLPQLNVNGASYSANPAHRMLIVNGAVVHEGQEVAPGLTLERIGLHQAVVRQGGLRFSIAY